MAKIIALLIILFIFPSIIGYATESTFKELGISENIYIDSNSTTKTISLAHNLPTDNGAYYITLNAYGENTKLRVSINKQLVKVLDLNEFGEEKTYKLRVDNHYLKPTNIITITAILTSDKGFLEINTEDSKVGNYKAPVITVQKYANARILEAGQSINITLSLKNDGYSAANLVIEDELPDDFVVTSGTRKALMTLQPEEEKNIEYTLKAIRETELTLGNPKVEFTDNPQYSDVIFLNPYTQHIYIENPEPQIRITNSLENSILDKNEKTKFSLLIKNTGLVPVDSIIIKLTTGGGIHLNKTATAISVLAPGQQSKVEFIITADSGGDATINCQANYIFGKTVKEQACTATAIHINEDDVFVPIMLIITLILVSAILFAIYKRISNEKVHEISLDAVMQDLQAHSGAKWAHKKHKPHKKR